LNACPYLATSFFHYRPLIQDSIEATTILTQGAERRSATLQEIYEAGFDMGCLYVATKEGKLFPPLCEPFHPQTKVTSWRQDDFEAIFLDCKRSSNEWWDSL